MNQQRTYSGTSGGRVQWGSYGFMAGIVVGVMLGWFFNGIVGAIFRLGMAAVIIIPLVLVFIAWRKVIVPWLRPPTGNGYSSSPIGAIETRGVVHEPRAR